jgi:organic radical activating enzyme
VKTQHLLHAWRKILAGGLPALSIEVTRECPLSCPGCYAYGNDHLGGGLVLKGVRDFKGQELIDGILRIVDAYRPLHVSLVGGEPLVRHTELTALLPLLEARNIHTQVVTSAVRPIPEEWRALRKLNLVVSIDGLQPEHDARRKPATYERILKHIAGHGITVHCTITRQMTERAGYLREFLEFWSPRREVRRIWLSLFTPQKGETSYEILPPDVRVAMLDELSVLKDEYSKLQLPDSVLRVYRDPPRSPNECLFARTTRPISADLKTIITPCQFGGTPDCSQCGCFASAALGAVLRHRLPLGLSLGTLYQASCAIGQWIKSLRHVKAAGVHGS